METAGSVLEGRVRDLVSTADRQLASRSYDAAVDTYRTALAEVSGGAAAAVRAEIEGRLAAALQARDTAQRVAVFLSRARYQQTAGRLSEAFAAVTEALSLDPSGEAAAQLRQQLLQAMPELAMQAETPTSEAAPLPQLVVEARTAAEAVPPMVEPAPPPAQPQLQPDERPIEPPSFRLLESDDPLLERSNREEYTGAAEPELLSILDPAPRPAPACCMGGSVHRRLTIVIAVLVSMAIGSAVYRGTRRMNRFTPPAPTDGAAYSVGAGVTVPALRFKVEPEYTEEARQAKIQGTVVLYVEIDPRGNPIHIRVLRGLDLGLSERAIEAVRKWRFRPGTKDGQPVTTRATVEVHFRLP